LSQNCLSRPHATPDRQHRRQRRRQPHLFRRSSAGSRYSRPSGPMADTWATYSPDLAQWNEGSPRGGRRLRLAGRPAVVPRQTGSPARVEDAGHDRVDTVLRVLVCGISLTSRGTLTLDHVRPRLGGLSDDDCQTGRRRKRRNGFQSIASGRTDLKLAWSGWWTAIGIDLPSR
jgi:hypothetical protein